MAIKEEIFDALNESIQALADPAAAIYDWVTAILTVGSKQVPGGGIGRDPRDMSVARTKYFYAAWEWRDATNDLKSVVLGTVVGADALDDIKELENKEYVYYNEIIIPAVLELIEKAKLLEKNILASDSAGFKSAYPDVSDPPGS